jgi:alpha-tubulin suppressor-like RCC1 family protein
MSPISKHFRASIFGEWIYFLLTKSEKFNLKADAKLPLPAQLRLMKKNLPSIPFLILFLLAFLALAHFANAQSTTLSILTHSDLGSVALNSPIEPIQLQAQGGKPLYTWSLKPGPKTQVGQIPPGLSLSASGILSGIPTVTQPKDLFIVQVTDADNAVVEQKLNIEVGRYVPQIFPPGNLSVTTDLAFSKQFQVVQGKLPYNWTTNSTLPAGLVLSNSTGELSGIVTQATLGALNFKDYPILLRLTTGSNGTASANFTLTVAKPFGWVTASALIGQFGPGDGQTAGPNCTISLLVSGGKTPYNFRLKSGNLPPGLNLNSASGNITGRPTENGNYTFTINCTDALKNIIERDFALEISPYNLKFNGGPQTSNGTQYKAIDPLQYSAQGGMPPYTYTASNLPSGLKITTQKDDSGFFDIGVITGNLTGNANTSNISIIVTDARSMNATRTCVFTVNPGTPLSWTIDPLPPAGQVGFAYSANLSAATGGWAPYTYNATGLPTGLTFNATTRRISGTPTAAGNFSVNFTVTDSATPKNSLTQAIPIAVAPYMTVSGPATVSGQQYTALTPADFEVTGGNGTYTWSTLATTPLPASLSINATTGIISGNLTAAPGNTTVTVNVRDSASRNATANLTITILPRPPLEWVTPSELPPGKVMDAYSENLTVSGGQPAYKFALKAGSILPAGLSLNNSTGALTGKPTTPGNFTFTINASDSGNPVFSSERTFNISIAEYGMSISGPDSISGNQYAAISPTTFTPVGGQSSYTWNATWSGNATALAINSASGIVSGNLTTGTGASTSAPGNYTMVIKLTDGQNQTANKTVAVRILPLTVSWITPAILPDGKELDNYSQTLQVEGAKAPYTFSLKTGSTLPPGISLNNSTGVLSGKPTADDTYTFTIIARDSSIPVNQSERTFTLEVKPYGMAITGSPTASGQQYTALTPVDFEVTGGSSPFTWSATPALPAGLTINTTTGLVSGNLTAVPANYTVAIKVSDANTRNATANFTVAITQRDLVVWVTPEELPDGKELDNYSQILEVEGGKSPYTFALKTGSVLPLGITLNATTGLLSGKPTVANDYTFTIVANDTGNPVMTAERTFTLKVAPYGMEITGPATESGQQYTALTPVDLNVTGGTAPFTWSTAPALPASLSINSSTGIISGNLTAAPGNTTVVVKVTDANSRNATANFTVAITQRDLVVWVTPEELPDGKELDNYSQILEVEGGKPSYTFALKTGSALPSGLTLNATTGLLSGKPTVANDYTFTILASDTGNPVMTAERTFTLKVAPYGMEITGPATASGQQYTVLTPADFEVSGGKSPYTWSVSPALPAALSINTSTGVISGNLTAAPGNYTVAIKVSDANTRNATANFTVTITQRDPLVWVTPEELPDGKELDAYSQNLTVSGGYASYKFALQSGTLPSGITLNATTGRLSGTASATSEGNYTFTVNASDSGTPIISQPRTFTLRIAPYGMAVTGPDSASGQQYSALTPADFEVTGGIAPHNWSATGLPTTLSINATTGIVSGNLTAAPGNYTANITVTDNKSQTASKNFAITILPSQIDWQTPENLPNGKVSLSYTQNLSVTGGKPPYTFVLANGSTLPPGLSLNNSTGVISGRPTTAGTSNFTITASDSGTPKNTKDRTFTLTIDPMDALVWTIDPAPASGKVAFAYSANLSAASGGSGNYSYSVNASTLPLGLSFNATTRTISGTPTEARTFNVSFTVRDNFGNATAFAMLANSTVQTIPIVIEAYGMSINGTDSIVGDQYKTITPATFTAVGGNAAYTWSANTTTGLSINATSGVVSGNLTAAPGNYTMVVRVSDGRNQTATANVSVTVQPLTLSWVTPPSLPDGQVASAYSTNLTVSGGRPPYAALTLASGALPPGMTLNATSGASTGTFILSGAPTAAGNYTFTLNASDSADPKNTANRTFTLSVKPYSMTLTGPDSITGQKFVPITPAQYLAANGTASYKWSLNSTVTGLSINATTGVVSGTPTVAAGNYTANITVTDSLTPVNQSITKTVPVFIQAVPALVWTTTSPLPPGQVAYAYSTNLTVGGGKSGYTYTLSNGTLPAGLVLNNSTGVISGTPAGSGTANFTITASDSDSPKNTASRPFALTIAPYGMTINGSDVISGQRYSTITPTPYIAINGTANYTWSANNTLGLTINRTTGVVSGNLTSAPGNYTLPVSVLDGRNQTVTKNVIVSIGQAPVLAWVTPEKLQGGRVSLDYALTVAATGGRSPYTYSVKQGNSLPNNLSLNSTTGLISGKPTAAGTSNFTLTARDSANGTVDRTFNLVIDPYGMGIVGASPLEGKRHQYFEYRFGVEGGRPSYTWNATTAPLGLSMNATSGVLSGTPTVAGNFTTVIRVTDGGNQSITRTFNINISASDAISIVSGPNFGPLSINSTYTTGLRALGGNGNYTWSILGTRPPSVNLTPTGVLTANSTTALTANFTVRVQDTLGANATRAMSVAFFNPATLVIATDALYTGWVGEEYSVQLGALGGTQPYDWAITSGTLPAGMSLSETGYIYGTPTASANATLTLRVTDAKGLTANKTLGLTIQGKPGQVAASGKLFTDVTNAATLSLPEHYIIAVEDFDNDGREDLLATNSASNVVLMRGVGAFDFRDITASAGLNGINPALVADFNNDGVSDILSVNLQRTEAMLFLNNGQGVFTRQVLSGLLTGDLANYRDISYADVDGDGDLDLLFNINATTGGGVVAVFNQSNVSQAASPLFNGKSYLVKTTWRNPKFSVTDANGDGKQDLVVVQTNGAWPNDTHRPQRASLYLNTGNTTADYANPTGAKTLAGFTEKLNSGITSSSEMSAFTSLDIDNDGDLDLLNGSSDWPWSGSIPRIYINDGTGTYAQQDSPILHGRFYHHGATVFDADLDGDQDAVWSALHVFSDVYPRMWENGATYLKATGNGTLNPAKAFFDSTTAWGIDARISGSGNMGSAGYAADLDADGDLDYIANLWSSSRTYKVYRNDSNLRSANWLKVELIGAVSPAQGTGARVEVELNNATAPRPAQAATGSRYEIVIGSFTWQQAKLDAEKRGGHLVTMSTEQEWNEVKTLIASRGTTNTYWGGATDEVKSGDWKWIDGTAVTLSKWSASEPNEYFGPNSENHLHIYSDGTWNDLPGTSTWVVGYICEYQRPASTTANSKVAQYLGPETGAVTESGLTFGLADKSQAARVTVHWPSGLRSILENVAGNRTIQIYEADELPLPRSTDEGDVIAWGANPNGETTVPTNLGKAVQIVAGDASSAALLANGTVSVWGTNWAAQRNVPATLNNVVQIAAGNNHYLALTANGSVVAWGWSTANQTVVPASLRRAKFIAAGFNTSYAVSSGGQVVAWGGNDVGQANVPAGLVGVTSLAAGRGHALALKSDGTVVAWGRNDFGQATVPAGLTNVVQITAGDYHSVALKSNGTVVAWGANWSAQSTAPVGLANVVQISAKGDRSLALKADNSIVNWGINPDNSTPPPSPGQILSTAAGSKHALGLVRKIQIAISGDLPTGTEGQVIPETTFSATGGSGAYTWSVVGTLPPGMTLNATTGKLSGTPTTSGNYTFTVRATSGGRFSDRVVTIEVQKAIRNALWVATTGNDTTGNGTVSKPYATITKAHTVANKGDLIKVLPGNYTESVVIEKAVEISSTAGPAQTIIRSANKASAVFCRGGGVKGGSLVGFTLTGGGGANNPGYNRYGGGFAINAPAGTSFEVKNCIIRNNSDAGITFGGGFHVTGGSTLKLTNSLIHSNAAWANGGAALIEGANLIADRCTIVSNTNNGFNRIGGISGAGNSNIQIKNSILWNNTTNQYGSFSSGPGGNATFTFSYSIVQGGTTATVGGNTKTLVNTGTGVLNSNPVFAETTNYSLGTGSPAINTGDPSAAKDADGSRADMGWDAAAANQSAGYVRAWGRNNFGQCDEPTDLAGVVQVAGGISDSICLKSDGSLVSWGKMLGQSLQHIPSYIPVGLRNVAQIASGFDYKIARKGDGSVVVWGWMWDGYRAVAAPSAADLNNALQVSAGASHYTVLKADGTVLSRGSNNWGELNVPSGLQNVVQVSAGAYHSVALKSDGTVVVWGASDHTAVRQVPAGLSGVVRIAAGGHFTVALKSDGTVVAWGLNPSGQINVPAGLSGVVDISASLIDCHALALKADGTVVAWGDNSYGQCSVPSGLSSVFRLSAGGGHSLVLTSAPPTSPKYAEMVLVQGGTLPVGSSLANQTVATFQIGKYEVTWAEWKEVRTWAAANGYDIGNVGQGSADNHPVQKVSWYDVVKWCNAKSQMEGFTPFYTLYGNTYKFGNVIPDGRTSSNDGYRLPTELEWEWAARGASLSRDYTHSGSNNLNDVAWYSINSGNSTHSVGTKFSNELGLFDMSGNVAEWCWDAYPGYGSPGFLSRHVRGGDYLNTVEFYSLKNRINGSEPEKSSNSTGFRLVRTGRPTFSFSYAGALQPWVVPANVTQITFDLKGATGGTARGGGWTVYGGLGASITGTLKVTPGETLHIVIGGNGDDCQNKTIVNGGFNGGGAGVNNSGSGGGGATDIRMGGSAPANRLVVAGGGGGANTIGGFGGGGGNIGPFNNLTTGVGGSGTRGGGGGGYFGGDISSLNGRGGSNYADPSKTIGVVTTDGGDGANGTKSHGSATISYQLN